MGKYLDEEKVPLDSRCCVAAKRGASKNGRQQPHENFAAGNREGQGLHPHQGGVSPCHQESLRLPGASLQRAGAKNQLYLFALGNLMQTRQCKVQADGASVS